MTAEFVLFIAIIFVFPSNQLIFVLYFLFKGFPKGIAYRGDLLNLKMILDLYTSEANCAGKYMLFIMNASPKF